jgi:peroxiredoxin
MKARWIAAAVGAVALAIFTLPRMEFGTEDTTGTGKTDGTEETAAAPAAGGEACDAKAKPADYSFTLEDMNGNDVKLADHKGKVILLDFWATWCAPCKYEIPVFVELYAKYREQGLVVLGVSVDDPIEKLRPFAAEYKMNYPVLIGRGRDDVQEAFGPVWGLPTTLLIGRNGLICKRHTGIATKEQFEREIKGLL